MDTSPLKARNHQGHCWSVLHALSRRKAALFLMIINNSTEQEELRHLLTFRLSFNHNSVKYVLRVVSHQKSLSTWEHKCVLWQSANYIMKYVPCKYTIWLWWWQKSKGQWVTESMRIHSQIVSWNPAYSFQDNLSGINDPVPMSTLKPEALDPHSQTPPVASL